MNKPSRIHSVSVALVFLTLPAGLRAADPAPATNNLPAETRTVLERYEATRAALAGDNLAAAKAAAAQLATDAARPETPAPGRELATPADTVAKSGDLKAAREAFKPLSAAAIRLSAGQPGFVVLHCPMTPNGDWLQTSAKVSNPYYGKQMLECGVVKK